MMAKARVRFNLLMLALLSGCGVLNPNTKFHEDVPAENSHATITGSRTPGPRGLDPVTLYVSTIDQGTVGSPKKARCNFNRVYRVTPGEHEVLVGLYAGSMFASSSVAVSPVVVNVELGQKLMVKGRVDSEKTAIMWIEDEPTGTVISARITTALAPSPAKGMPVGFAFMDDSCIGLLTPF